jgi:transcriptional regulator with XRE-family HTH domain
MAISESGPAAAEVARNIERVRKARQLKQKDVSDRLRKAGRPMLATVVSKVERGERRIDVDDLIAFGRALEVPPLLLLYPLGEQDEVEVLKGQRVPTWEALKWFVGDDRFPSERIPGGEIDPETGLPEWYYDPEEGWEEGAAPVKLYREHERLVQKFRENQRKSRRIMATRRADLREFRSEPDPDGLDEQLLRMAAETMRNTEEGIRTVRATMRMRGLKLPRLPEDLAGLDEPPEQ